MKLEDLLIMDMCECVDWLVDNINNYELVKRSESPIEGWVSVASPEDLPIGEEVLCWDGCQHHLDYADMDAETGAHYMANGTEVEAYQVLTQPEENK
jgi:hypothetical protein